MDDAKSIPTVGRMLQSEEGLRARKIAALKSAYQDGELNVDEAQLARRLLEAAIDVQRNRLLLDSLPSA